MSGAKNAAVAAPDRPETRAGLPVLAFPNPTAFAAWIEQAGPHSTGLWLKLAKKGSAAVSLTKAQAIDEALCSGWIDGQLDK